MVPRSSACFAQVAIRAFSSTIQPQSAIVLERCSTSEENGRPVVCLLDTPKTYPHKCFPVYLITSRTPVSFYCRCKRPVACPTAGLPGPVSFLTYPPKSLWLWNRHRCTDMIVERIDVQGPPILSDLFHFQSVSWQFNNDLKHLCAFIFGAPPFPVSNSAFTRGCRKA